MSIRAGIVVAVALHEVNHAPDTKPGSQSYNKGLQNAYCRIKKCHKVLLSCRVCGCPKKGIKNGGQFSITAAVISPRAAFVAAARRYSVVRGAALAAVCCAGKVGARIM